MKLDFSSRWSRLGLVSKPFFGKGHAQPFNEFLRMRWEIIGAARALSQLRQRTYFPTEDQQKKHRAEMEKYERIVWPWPKDDPFEESFTNAIASIEKFAGPLLESRLRPRKVK